MKNKFSPKQPSNNYYLIPNSVTTLGLFSGFYSIIAASQNNFEAACIAIFVAMIFDGLDGRIARLTNTQSAFGAQFDSLADLISFGLAPALLAFHFGLSQFGKVGWASVFLFLVFAAIRLARFNVNSQSNDLNYFQGLASPAAAGLLASFIWVAIEFDLSSPLFLDILIFVVPAIGLLMVSNFRYSAFKNINLNDGKPFVVILLFVLVFVTILIRPAEILFVTFFAYAISAPLLSLRSVNVANLASTQDADFTDKKDEK